MWRKWKAVIIPKLNNCTNPPKSNHPNSIVTPVISNTSRKHILSRRTKSSSSSSNKNSVSDCNFMYSKLSAMNITLSSASSKTMVSTPCLTLKRVVVDVISALSMFYIGAFGFKQMTGGKPWTFRDIPYQKINVNGESTILLDLELNNELIPEHDVTFNDAWLWFCAVQLPLLLVLVLSRLNFDSNHSDFPLKTIRNWDTLGAFCGIMFGLGISEFATNVVKYYVGRLRPNFYNLCEFDIQTLQCTAELANQYQARKSFPSGHSSLSFTGLTFVVLYLFGRFGVCNMVKAPFYSFHTRRALFLLCTLPWSLALWIAASRSVDNWHHPSDIISGSLLGIVCATISYHMW